MQYFTISEFARLRNININSLRYYEKKGLLAPAYIDEKTKYRYYSAEQLPTLDTILLCIDLGIPLKNLTQYLDEQGVLQFQKLLVEGKALAQQRIEKIQRNLNSVEFFLQNMEQNRVPRDKNTVYERHIRRRHIIMTTIFPELPERRQIEIEVAKLYKTAQENALMPLLPANQLLIYQSPEQTVCSFFLEVATKENTGSNLSVLPEGMYPCITVDRKDSRNTKEIIQKNWGYQEGMAVIVYNVHVEKCNFGSEPTELQLTSIRALNGLVGTAIGKTELPSGT